MAINPISSDPTAGMLHKLLDVTYAQQRVLSNNIANVNTPQYTRRKLAFGEAFQNAVRKGDLEGAMRMRGSVQLDQSLPARQDGNNVSLPLELQALSRNGLTHQLLTQALKKKIGILRSAIGGGK